MKRKFFIFFILFITISCSKDTKTTYRIVGKDGKVMYIDTRDRDRTRKSFKSTNEEQIKNKPEIEKINKNKIIKQIEEKKIPLISSAYTLDSVIDKDVKYDVGINDSFKDISSNKKRKTITDFDNIQSSYFNDMNINNSSRNKKPVSKSTDKKSDFNILSNNSKKTSYHVQLGLFSDKERAIKLKDKFSNIYDLDLVETKNKKGETLYKVLTKAIENKSEANSISEKIKKAGHNDVFVFKK